MRVMKGDCSYWLLFLDLDGTLWDHKDISSLKPPFSRVDKGTIKDSNGVIIRLYEESLKLLKWARSNGAIVSTLSWNIPEKAMDAIKAFGLENEFDYFVITPEPNKGGAALKFLEQLKKKERCILPPCAIVYIDERDIHLKEVKEKLGNITFLMIWKDFSSFEDGRKLIEEKLSECKDIKRIYRAS